MTQSRAILCALAAFFVYVCYDTLSKVSMGHGGVTPLTIMAVAGTTGALVVLIPTLFRGKAKALKPQKIIGLALICLCSVGMRFCNNSAVKLLPLTVFYTLLFASPLAISALSAALKHEVLTKTKVVCLITGFIGVLIAVVPKITTGGELIGYIAIGGSIFCFSIYTVAMRKTSQTETIEAIQFFNFLSIGAFGFCGSLWQSSPWPEESVIPYLIAAGLFFALGNVLFNKALKHTSSSNVAQIHYTQIISGALFGYLIWHDIPSLNLVAGSALIIASGIVVARQARKNPVA
ncbi:MAG: DMT family transporter [Alphaproteobacteria bacterium]|nr:DMT family transporter [Alphaproteobacteria bacterium]